MPQGFRHFYDRHFALPSNKPATQLEKIGRREIQPFIKNPNPSVQIFSIHLFEVSSESSFLIDFRLLDLESG